jgi:hypothetical protein
VGRAYFLTILSEPTVSAGVAFISSGFQFRMTRAAEQSMTRADVAKTIEDFLAGTGQPWDWDDFTSVHISDPNLEAIRKRCAQLDLEFPPEKTGHYCGPAGFEVLRQFVRELRANDG